MTNQPLSVEDVAEAIAKNVIDGDPSNYYAITMIERYAAQCVADARQQCAEKDKQLEVLGKLYKEEGTRFNKARDDSFKLKAERDQAIAHVKLLREALKAGNRWFMPHDTSGIDEIDQKRRKEYQAWAEQYEQALAATDSEVYQ